MDILDPAGGAAVASRALATRPATLRGLTVAVLDNAKPNAGVLLERVAGALVERFGAATVRVWRKPGSSAAAGAAVLDEIARQCGVALTGSAD
ncbi:MAG TPA: hypothetical protein VFN71_13670 [Methylomirabilota bacterium]|nr:hypothetical protein [Methylomirabilota bacterium]